jgi:hypothetical protein
MSTNLGNVNEDWVKIPGEWKREYYISNLGRIKYPFYSKAVSLRTPAVDKYLKLSLYNVNFGSGYLGCTLSRNGLNSSVCYIHRLLAICFIDNPHNKPQVNHIDGNSLNNSLTNLEWVTAKENIRHAWDIGLCTPHSIRGSKKSVVGKSFFEERTSRVFELRNAGMSQKAIGEVIGIHQSEICRILNNKQRSKTA